MASNSIPFKHRDLVYVLLCLVGLIVVYHVGTAIKGHGAYRDQHLGTALHYAATKIDLKHTIIIGMNATETPTILEVPIWQMATGVVFKLFGTWWGWGNIVSLVLFLNCLYPLFSITRQFYGERAAWWSLIFFLAQALIFYYAGTAGTDGFCVSTAIWFWFACCRMLENPAKWFLPAVFFGSIIAVSKLPFFMAAGLAALFLLLKVRGLKVLDLALLAGVGMISGVVFLLWTRFVESLQVGAVFPFVDLRLSGSTEGMSTMFWYFGDLHYRLNPVNWIKAFWRLADDIFGSFSLIPLFVFAFASRRVHPAAKFHFAGAFLTTLVFSHLILHHHHYLMLFSPSIAILCAVALTEVEGFVERGGLSPAVVRGTISVVIFAALFQGLMAFRAFSFDKFPDKIAAAIRANTTPEDKLVVINGGWGGDELMRTGRNGLSMWDAHAFENPDSYARLKKLGFNKLVVISQSPYQNAIQIVNPGQTGIPRQMARDFVTPVVDKWPTVYASEDIIIKEIP